MEIIAYFKKRDFEFLVHDSCKNRAVCCKSQKNIICWNCILISCITPRLHYSLENKYTVVWIRKRRTCNPSLWKIDNPTRFIYRCRKDLISSITKSTKIVLKWTIDTIVILPKLIIDYEKVEWNILGQNGCLEFLYIYERKYSHRHQSERHY